jgi:diguanylate cyclase (GGDEF)-like protein
MILRRTLDSKILRAVVCAGVAFIVCSMLLLQLQDGRESAARTVGVVFEERTSGLLVVEAIASAPAARAGLRAGDMITAINGHETLSERDYDEAASRFETGGPQVYTVTRRGESLDLQVVPGVDFDWLVWSINSAAAMFHLALGLLVLFQPSRGLLSRLAWVLFLAIALELALPTQTVGMPMVAFVAEILFWLLTGLQFSVELHLASVLPEPQGWFVGRRLPKLLYYGFGLGFGVLVAASWLLALEELPLFAWLGTDAGSLFFDAWFMIWVVGVVLLLANTALRWPSATGRHQALLVLFGVAPWALLTAAVTWWNQTGNGYPGWLAVAQPLVLALYPIAVFLAISRYRLFNIELVVRRSLVYTALSGALVLVFYAALGAGTALMSTLLEGRASQVWIIGGATLTLGLVFGPLRRGLERLIEGRFFPERAALRERLGTLVRELPERGNLLSMSTALVSNVAEIFAARSVTLLLAERDSEHLVAQASHNAPPGQEGLMTSKGDPLVELLQRRKRALPTEKWPEGGSVASWLLDLEIELVVPLLRGDELTGMLIVGRKEAGGGFRSEEVELLELLCTHVATVLENAHLFESATVDTLTGLLRREAVMQEMQRELERAIRYRRPLVVGMADIDRFKEINDRYGHLAGDLVLRAVAGVISKQLRSTDLVGRFGGEEFLLLLPESDLVGAVRVVEKLREAVEGLVVETDAGDRLSVTVSVGVASVADFPHLASVTSEAILSAADASLYRAKEGGRNRVAVAG